MGDISWPTLPVCVRPDTPARPYLIALVPPFVRAASHLPGVERIALIGSLTTAKVDPKNIDLLVTVTDDADLAPLAAMTRKLSGRAQGLNRGGEVFLASPNSEYLGRVCQWRDCRPGIRMSCDAVFCGRRHYLHDDLETITLALELIAEPPLELWPRVVARVPLPEDVASGIAQPLHAGGAADAV